MHSSLWPQERRKVVFGARFGWGIVSPNPVPFCIICMIKAGVRRSRRARPVSFIHLFPGVTSPLSEASDKVIVDIWI